MRSRTLGAGAAILAGIALVPSTGAAACTSVTVTSSSSGRTVKLKRCQQLVVSLSQSSDGGYLWRVAAKPKASVLKLESATSVRPAQPPGVVGGNTTEVYVFKAIARGATSFKLVEARSFQKNSTVQTFTLRVSVG